MDTIKALHIIFVVTWFAGLFYIFRLFVYHAEAQETKEEFEREILVKQYKIMEWRLWYIITWPSAILTLILGVALLFFNPGYLTEPWMLLKLFFVFCLFAYQIFGQVIFKNLYEDRRTYKAFHMRMLNEVSTLILIAVVFLVVRKDELSWVWGILSIIGIGLILTYAVRSYANYRKNGDPS
jgi:putative membrane protein